MSGLKQELGLAQGVGLLSTSLLGTGVSPFRHWRRWSPAITASGPGRADFTGVSHRYRLCHAGPPLSQRRRRGAFCAYGLWPASGARHRLALFIGDPGGLPAALHIATGFGQALLAGTTASCCWPSWERWRLSGGSVLAEPAPAPIYKRWLPC
jgi:amino acid efflux transporter